MTSVSKNALLTAIFLCAVFLFTFFAINNTDLGFILKTGQYIWEHHEIPHNDIFSFSAPGVDWIAHYWLTGVLFYGIFLLGGYLGLKISVALVAALTFFFVIKRFGLYSKDYPLFLILFYPLTFFSFEFWNVRGENFSNLFLAILLYLIDQWRFKKSKWALYLIPLLSMLWANMHGGVLLGLAILGFWAAVSLYEAHFALSKIKIQASVFVAACLASLLNPFGYKSPLLLFLLNSKGISEFQSILADFISEPDMMRNVALGAMVLTTVFLMWRQYSSRKNDRRPGRLYETGLVLVAFIMPMVSVRYTVFFPLITLPLMIKELSIFLKEKFPEQDAGSLWKAALGVGFIMIAGRLPFVISQPDINTEAIAVGATDFVKNANVPEPLFNGLGNGGWLIWKLWPERKVFIDGRSDIYKYGVYDDYLTIESQSDGWINLVNEKYKFNSFLVPYRSSQATAIAMSHLIDQLTNDLGFKLIYWDNDYIILARDTPENQEIIKKYAYSVIGPFKNPASIPKDKRKLALEEIRRALSISPDSKVLKDWESNMAFLANLSK